MLIQNSLKEDFHDPAELFLLKEPSFTGIIQAEHLVCVDFAELRLKPSIHLRQKVLGVLELAFLNNPLWPDFVLKL